MEKVFELELKFQISALKIFVIDLNTIQDKLLSLANKLSLKGEIERRFNRFEARFTGSKINLEIFSNAVERIVNA